jgi:signal transduction histidine kinase
MTRTPKKTGQLVFAPRARILRLLGEELISDEIIAVSELVKNAHDADARQCVIRFDSVTAPDGEIRVEDDGRGMSLDEFLHGWMQPGASEKRRADRHYTARGRRVLGEKGVGRFAADKLAGRLEIVTRKKGSNEIHASFCWDDFDDDSRLLSDVTSQWQEREAGVIDGSGTVLRMKGLRSRWNERMFRRLCVRLARLVSPFSDRDGFHIIIDSDEFPDYAGELRNDLLDRAPYQLEASFDGDDGILLQVGSRKWKTRWPGPGNLACGPVKVHLYAFDLDTTSLARIGPKIEVRAWLREWTGVNVYRDGFRVWPYGEPHDDWLGLDQRRVNNPVVRLSNNQVIGFVEIGRDTNPLLLDQTNREGLIHNAAFEDLRRLVHFFFLEIENHRQSIRHPDNGRAEANGRHEQGPVAALQRIAAGLPAQAGAQVRRVGEEIQAHIAQLSEQHRRTLESYAELAASGQVLLGVETEFRAALAAIQDALALPHQVGDGRGGPAGTRIIGETVELLLRRLSDLHSIAIEGERRRTVDLDAELRSAVSLIRERARQAGIRLSIKSPPRNTLARAEIRPENVRRILLLLFDNAVHHFTREKDRQVEIRIWVRGRSAGFDFSDNGPGVPADRAEDVFLPHYTTRSGASGMGLTIVRQICRAHGGEASVVARAGGGTTVRVQLKRKQSRAT